MRPWRTIISFCLSFTLYASNVAAGIVLDASVAATNEVQPDSTPELIQNADRALDNADFTAAATILQTALHREITADKPEFNVYSQIVERVERLNKRLGQQAATIELLQSALKTLDGKKQPLLFAMIVNDLGKAQSDAGDYNAAVVSFAAAVDRVEHLGKPTMHVRMLSNYFDALVDSKQYSRSEKTARTLITAIERLPASAERTSAQLFIAYRLAASVDTAGLSDAIRLDIYEMVKAALASQEVKNEASLLSLAYGTMGLLYGQERRFEESTHYTRRAVFHAQSANATEFLFRWQWQLGRAFKQLKREDVALQHYRQAFVTLQRIRHQLLLDRSDSFVKTISPIYNEYLDVFTQHIHAMQDPASKQVALEQLRLAIEQLKVAEIEDYYQSACFDDTEPAKTGEISDNATVAIYPVILNDRIELLLKRKEGLALYSHKAKRDHVAKTILGFRAEISEYSANSDYLALGQQLYKMFVTPYEADLKSGDTLVFVAAWMLRTVPMAALYDGKQFLVEKYALVTTPSLVLTNTEARGKGKMRVLANGITDAVQGYDALSSVQQELESIASIYQAVVLKNQDFSVQRAQQEIGQGNYGIIHVATHGEFDSDFRKSYVLGYDDKITLATLEKTVLARRFTDKPIELLVLSACQTATGDDRAALGLAGVAVKAGARSALATLWFISDEATSQLIGQFYQKLQTQTVSKAEALRQAQVALISTDRYKHPNLWAPFILIGNWY